MTDEREAMMDIDDVAEYLRLSRSSVYKMAAGGELPGHKVGKHWRFRKSTIDHWLDTHSNVEARPQRDLSGGRSMGNENADRQEVASMSRLGARSMSAAKSDAVRPAPAGSDLEGALSAHQIAQLAERWIVNAEQFIAVASQPAGREGIGKLLGLAPENVSEIARSLEARPDVDARHPPMRHVG